MDAVDWMAWTSATFVFVVLLVGIVAAFTVAAIVRPSRPTKGFLPIRTARGDRLYISLIGCALFLVLYIALTDLPLHVGLAAALLVWVAPVFKWG
jgi:predicted small integral membrane protein